MFEDKPIDFFCKQLSEWQMAADAFCALRHCKQRQIDVMVGNNVSTICLLYNPSRQRSTTAAVDAKSVSQRPCFLCKKNRPEKQLIHNGLLAFGFQILVNPYPILSPHFTIVSNEHRPQHLPFTEMLEAAIKYPGLAFFFNGAKVGASAPDHLHFQAVAKTDVPLLTVAEAKHNVAERLWSGDMGVMHPAGFWSILCSDKSDSELKLQISDELINVFVWQRADGKCQCIVFPRSRHRADSYPDILVSPGALDVAGIMVVVRYEDFENITSEQIGSIYSQTCYSPLKKP